MSTDPGVRRIVADAQARADARRDMRQALEREARAAAAPAPRPRGRPPNPTPRQGGVRITPGDREQVTRARVTLAGLGLADQARAVGRLLQSWENRRRHSGSR